MVFINNNMVLLYSNTLYNYYIYLLYIYQIYSFVVNAEEIFVNNIINKILHDNTIIFVPLIRYLIYITI